MINERLQRVGSFSIELDPAASMLLATQVAEGGHIVITPTPANPLELSDASILAQAMWTGVVTEPPVDGKISGWGAGWWLGGNGQHAGDALETMGAVSLAGVTLTSAMSTLLPGTAPIVPGTVDSTGLSTITSQLGILSRWDAVNAAVAYAGAEFIIRPNFTIDAASQALLFPTTTTPTVLVTTNPEPVDMNGLRGIEIATATPAVSFDQYATKVLVVAQSGDGTIATVGQQSRATSYKDGRGNTAVLKRFVNMPATPGANAATMAQAVLNLSTLRKGLSVTAKSDRLGRVIQPGDSVWIWAQDAGIIDTANQVTYRGETISPVKVRVYSISWPVEDGSGVYYRDLNGVYIDLTRYMVWEDDDTVLEIGAGPVGQSDDTAVYQPSGASADILARLPAASTAWTPVLGATVTNPTLGTNSAVSGLFRIDGGECHFLGSVQFGDGTGTPPAAGSGNYQITGLPVTPVAGRPTFLAGRARLTRNSPAAAAYFDILIDDTSKITFRYASAAPSGTDTIVSNTAPWAWTTRDRLEFEGKFPLV